QANPKGIPPQSPGLRRMRVCVSTSLSNRWPILGGSQNHALPVGCQPMEPNLGTHPDRSVLSRRDFVKTAALGVAAAAAPLPAEAQERTKEKTIGIQIGAVSFVDEGVEKVLDILQERGAINTIFLTTFTYG